MNREDVLRELELLPVWKLRTPPKTIETHIVKVAIEAAPTAAMKLSYECTISDDKKWCFISQNGKSAGRMDVDAQSILFKNILHALKINKTNIITLENIGEAKIIIAMGEAVVQHLLNSTESIEQLRGKTHTCQNIPLIVTYDTQELLQNLVNKAKTWDDLCMALNIVNA
jgi:uracil-DNA glycosylase